MTGSGRRSKGRRGQCEAERLLCARDWQVIATSSGRAQEDIVAQDPAGKLWSVEVKNQKLINLGAFEKQAREQAAKRKMPWLLLCRLPGHGGCWIVTRQGCPPAVWKEG